MKANDHWNNRKSQFNCNKFEWVDPKKNYKKNTFCSSNHKFYIKNGKQTCDFVGNLKLKPIDYVMLFKRQYHSAALTASISSSTVAKTNKKYSNTSSMNVKNMFHEAPSQIASVIEPQ